MLSHQLTAIDDQELLESGKVLSRGDISALMRIIKQLLHKMFWVEPLFDANAHFMEPLAVTSPPRSFEETAGMILSMRSTLIRMQFLSCNASHVLFFSLFKTHVLPFLSVTSQRPRKYAINCAVETSVDDS